MLQRMLALLVLALVVAACNGPAITTLTVTNLVPNDGATGVAVDTVVSATFNIGINQDTLDGAFTLTRGGETVAGDLAYDAGNRTATFTPASALAFGTTYTATVAGTVATDDGVALGGAASWSFTTASESGDGTMAFVDANRYADFEGDADINAEAFTLPFPAFTGAQGTVTYTLHSGELPPPFETRAYTNPETLEDIPAATYSVTLDASTGAISGVTGFPGTFEGVVRATDATGDYLQAPFSLDLAFVMAYEEPFERTVGIGDGIAVEGARVTISGANALALTEIEGMARTFSLVFVEGESSGGATAGAFGINANDGTISKVEDDSTFPSVWVYDVFATHTDTGLVSETFRFTFTLEPVVALGSGGAH